MAVSSGGRREEVVGAKRSTKVCHGQWSVSQSRFCTSHESYDELYNLKNTPENMLNERSPAQEEQNYTGSM